MLIHSYLYCFLVWSDPVGHIENFKGIFLLSIFPEHCGQSRVGIERIANIP